MKTMTEQECRAFVMSGFIPTSNDDVADIQDCFLHQSFSFLTGLLIDPETESNAHELYSRCLYHPTEMKEMVERVNAVRQLLTRRAQYTQHIEHLKAKIADMEQWLEETKSEAMTYAEFIH